MKLNLIKYNLPFLTGIGNIEIIPIYNNTIMFALDGYFYFGVN